MVLRAFDDRLRAEIGEVSVDANRDAIREGRLCLTAGPGCMFSNLDVRGLTLFEFAATPSRYASFAAHIQSWDGNLPELMPDDMGAGTTSTTVAALWSATAADVAQVMQPNVAPLEREALFSRWATDLGLALRAAPERTSLATFAEGTATRMIVLESPEPIDFTEEVTVTLSRVTYRVVKPVLPDAFDPVLPIERDKRFSGNQFSKQTSEELKSNRKAMRRPEYFLKELTDAAMSEDTSPETLDTVRTLELFEVADDGVPNLRDVKTNRLEDRDTALGVRELLKERNIGDRLVIDAGELPSRALLERVETPVEVKVLQNGVSNKALIIPVDGAGNAVEVTDGQYLLRFQMTRKRWNTSDATDDLNTYERETSVTLRI
jgi:hypothetical protein